MTDIERIAELFAEIRGRIEFNAALLTSIEGSKR